MHPILNQIGTTFIPVKNIEQARDWYCDLLGVPNDEEITAGHLYILPMQGTGIVLDSKIYSKEAIYKIPAFHFDTTDIKAAYEYMRQKDVDIVSKIEHDHWFTFKDPDGNLLMVCEC
ncbi:VOC family protein [Halobacillus sp. A1]|uniref:VOC family protein n=1 Tax=Halobacillus sp. A1 TaxID=2880262 RepID=UPI0020A68005|nr:VOC family protein [Halobacillus sp. A1]MCP3032194.1 VOC family protein [Halobacillus sp. A1]